MTDHDRALDLAALAVDFELSPYERQKLEWHLAGCDACRRRSAAFRDDAAALAAPSSQPLDHAHADLILATVLGGSQRALGSWQLALVAALLVLVALGSAVAGAELIRHARSDLSVVPSPPAELVASAVPRGSPSPAGSPGVHWTRVPLGAASAVIGLTAWSGSFIAVGQTSARAAAWMSVDGATWRPATMQGSGTYVDKALPFRSGLVAVGCATGVGCLSTQAASGAWTSPDGRTWTARALPLDRPYATTLDIAASSTEAIILGSTTDCPPSVGGVRIVLAAAPAATCSSHAVAWWSTDGVAWHLVPITGCAIAPAVIVAAADGSFVALPSAPSPACLSADGRSWRQARTDVPFMPGTVSLGGGSNLLAVGDGGIWTSTDGSAWRLVSDASRSSGRVTRLSNGGALIVALGDGPDVPVVWMSSDGASWIQIPLDATFAGSVLRTAAMGGGRLVVVGGARVGPGAQPAYVWSTSPPALP